MHTDLNARRKMFHTVRVQLCEDFMLTSAAADDWARTVCRDYWTRIRAKRFDEAAHSISPAGLRVYAQCARTGLPSQRDMFAKQIGRDHAQHA